VTTLSDVFEIRTAGKGLYDITPRIESLVRKSKITSGQAAIFVQHTSAGILIFENADPSAAVDLLSFFARLVPETGSGYTHTAEGPDDMTSHIRVALTRSGETIPIVKGRLALGVWQGVFLFEHHRMPHLRSVAVSLVGEH